MSAPRIVFMGTPPFAVSSLEALHTAGIPIAAVVTAPDRPAGRGRQLRASAVKEAAQRLGLRVLQPERVRDEGFLEELRACGADLFVVVAFRMRPEVVWRMPRLGTGQPIIQLRIVPRHVYRFDRAAIQRLVGNAVTELPWLPGVIHQHGAGPHRCRHLDLTLTRTKVVIHLYDLAIFHAQGMRIFHRHP